MTDTNKKMQADEYSRAVSFANGYFALVDDLAYGFENHLVENVRLEWFGRVIIGRKNVAAFMRNHVPNSRHMFAEIVPISKIDSGICEVPRQKYKRKENSTAAAENITGCIDSSDLSFSSLRIEDEAASKKEDMKYDLNDSDVEHFPPHKTTPNRSEIAIKIPKIEEDQVLDNYAFMFDKSLMNFVECKGIVQVNRQFAPNKIRKRGPACFNSGETAHQWRRRCILKLAYSTKYQLSTKSEENLTKPNTFEVENNACAPMDYEQNTKRDCSYTPQRRKRLKSSDDIFDSEKNFNTSEASYSFDEKKRFLEYFQAEIAASDAKFDLTTPKYVGSRLVFDAAEKIDPQCREYLKSFKFDYLIHTIVYESNIECKLNLSEEFEKDESVKLGE